MIIEILQWAAITLLWVALLALLASRAIIQHRLGAVKAEQDAMSDIVNFLYQENLNTMLGECCFCQQTWLWHEREQATNGAWIHRNKDGRIVFCGLPGTTEPSP